MSLPYQYVRRQIEPVLTARASSFPAVAVTGPRQSGKSTLLRHTLPDYGYLSLDDPFARRQAHEDPELLLDSLPERAVIDEIQYAPELLNYIKIRIDADPSVRGRFVLAGSQQFAMTRHLTESLAGRVGLLELLPFSVEELREFRPDGLDTLAAFEFACLRGSYPDPALREDLESDAWYASYVQTYLERDIRSLYDIGSLREFDALLRMLASRCSQQLNLSGLSKEVGVSVNTVRRWISVLEACRILYLLPPYFNNLGKRITKAPKVYFTDCGLVCHLIRLSDFGHLLHGPLAGALFENFCVQETLKAALNAGRAPRMYYLRAQSGLEVDLLLEGANGALTPVEIKVSRTPKREMAASLERFASQFAQLKPQPAYVLSLSDRRARLTEGVSLLPLDDYLQLVASNS